uniref:SGNH/GDSL hydrolase family protein n=1 Tax=candidate division WOR-3 bacterium TaxID=2052148 RepID=A0A7V1EIY0_UNCW3
MEKKSITAIFCIMLIVSLGCKKEDNNGNGNGGGQTITGENIFNHTCADLSQIPAEWIDSVKANLKIHYAHTSHGEQLTIGLERIENSNSTYSVAIDFSNLPDEPGALCIFDGQENEIYITPDLYWESQDGMNNTRAVLSHNPEINVSMWCWCTQLDYYTQSETQAYLDSITKLASEFPNVTFVFFTGNAQAIDADGYNRHTRNQQIRQFCNDHHFACFDFADLDAWYYDGSSWEQATYDYNGTVVPCEHPNFHGDEGGHTTFESCEQKGKAVWWMLARIAGWQGP